MAVPKRVGVTARWSYTRHVAEDRVKVGYLRLLADGRLENEVLLTVNDGLPEAARGVEPVFLVTAETTWTEDTVERALRRSGIDFSREAPG